MKWIGQYIYDQIAKFRSDVYLEGLSTTTETNVLVVDVKGKVSKSTSVAGDLTSIVAGTGLSGTDLTGPIPTLNVDASIPEVTTLAGLTSFGAISATTNIVAGHLTMYNNVNDANPTIRVGSSSTNNFEIQAVYNSGDVILDTINFTTRSSGINTHDGQFKFYVDEVHKSSFHDNGMTVYGYITLAADGALFQCNNQAASSATEGGKLILRSDDGAAMGSGHRLGVIEFEGAEDASNNRTVGARIEAMTDAAWSDTENGARLDFYTTDGNASESKVLTLDSDQLATFASNVYVDNGDLTVTNRTTSSATQGGSLRLIADDDDELQDNHRLGVIEFQSREVGNGGVGYSATGNIQTGARIQAIADATWSSTENGTSLEFYTTDGNASESKVLTLDSDKLATFAGAVTATGALTGTLATVSQPNITGVGTIGTGVWNGTAIASAYLDADTAHLAGTQTFTGTKTLNSFKGTAGATVTNILDEDAMGSDSATALATQQSIKAYGDRARYSYTYLTWSASAVSSMDGSDPEWVFPNTVKGIYEEDWTKDENIKATTVGATTFTTGRQTAVNGLVIPHAGECVGFHAHGRNNNNDTAFKTGLFHYEGSTVGGTNNGGVDYGATGNTHECTLRWIATAIETEASGGADGTASHSFKGPCKLVSNTDALAVSAGDVLMPAIMGPDGSDEIYITMSIILKIPIV